MKFVLLFSFLLTLLLNSLAQDSITIGSIHKVDSTVLREQREYWIYLPSDYNNRKYAPAKYPVIYLLDADNNFFSVAAIQQYLAKGMYAMIPQMIIVGILNTDRTRDFTPTHAPQERPGKKGMLYETSGGGENFVTFLQQELMPHIDSVYRTSDYRILTGHSFGALAAINSYLHHMPLFNAYIANDPSLWWDNEKLINEANSGIFSKKKFTGTNLYLSLAYKYISKQDTTTDHTRAIKRFAANILPTHQKNGLRGHWHYCQDDDHVMVSVPATYDGLKFLFKGFQTQVKQAADEPSIIEKNYKKLSAQLGYTVLPAESLIDAIGQYCLSQDKIQSAIVLFEMNKANYPTSSNVYASLADAFSKAGSKKKALEYYQQSLKLKQANAGVRNQINVN